MTKWKAFCRSFHKNVIVKRKYKAFWYLLTDKEYRRDLNRLYQLTKGCTKNEEKAIDIRMLVHGHKIVYPGYALSLFASAGNLPRIRVVFDPSIDKYVVVDGNHRLPALVAYARTSMYRDMIFCEVIS